MVHDLSCQEFLAKLDYEAFVYKVHNARGWTKEQANKEWERAKADNAVERDQKGPNPAMPLRLYFPSSLLGEDKVEMRRGKYETRELHQSSKPGKMSDKVQEQVQAELDQGFGSLTRSMSMSNFAANFTAALPSTAVTSASNTESMEITQQVLEVASALGGQVAPTPQSGTSDFDGRSQASEQQVPPSAAKNKDLQSRRNTAHSDLNREYNKLKTAANTVLQEASFYIALHQICDHLHLLHTILECLQYLRG